MLHKFRLGGSLTSSLRVPGLVAQRAWVGAVVVDKALDADVAAVQDDGRHEDQSEDDVADDQLPEGEEEDGLVAPVPRLVERGLKVRLPDPDQPVVAEDEPDGQEDVERHVGHPRHGQEVVVVV
ncbi:hypothetical protein BgiMline_023257 [Biomphalaria glabrata]